MDCCEKCCTKMDWNDDSGFELICPNCGNIQKGV